MNKDTEKIMRQLMQYLEDHQDELEDGVNEDDLAQRFVAEYNASLRQGKVQTRPQTADDYMDLADDATSKKEKLKYLNKALELEPDNLDAAHQAAELNAKHPEELLESLSALIEKGGALLEREGYFQDCMGEFWTAFETRPYMRLRRSRLEVFIQCGMMHRAVEEARELLKLCVDDNLGIRYTLMHLYAWFEDEEGALALQKEYDESGEAQMLLPLAVLYYKKAEFERSLQCLQRLSETNRDTKKFIHTIAAGDADKLSEHVSPYGYQANSIEELIYTFLMNDYLYEDMDFFFDWAERSLKKSSAPAKRGRPGKSK